MLIDGIESTTCSLVIPAKAGIQAYPPLEAFHVMHVAVVHVELTPQPSQRSETPGFQRSLE